MGIGLIELIKDDGGIPSLPIIFSQINEAVEDPNRSMADIAKIITVDQSLSSRLLRLVNSAFFSFPSKINTISQAVTLVGSHQVRDLALATSVIQLFKGIPTSLVNMKSFWKHGIGCGIASRLLATHHNEANTEHFFVAGLLHDIGRLILYKKNSEVMRDVLCQASENNEILHQVERKVLGYDHADVGGMILKEWQLPASLEVPVKYHHRPSRAPEYADDSGILHVADLITNAMELGTSGERLVPPLNGQSCDDLGLSPSIMESLSKELDQQYSDTISQFLDESD